MKPLRDQGCETTQHTSKSTAAQTLPKVHGVQGWDKKQMWAQVQNAACFISFLP